MELPENSTLPFFAYGLFKPDQLAFHKIQDLVKESSDAKVVGKLKDRDGIPIYVDEGNNHVKGALIYFNNGFETKAYRRISKFEPGSYYYWKKITTNNQVECNILYGKSPNKGTKEFEDNIWDGKNDPYFSQALLEISTILDNNARSEIGFNNVIPFFRLQMAYMLLWTSIERYATMKYYFGDKVYEKIKALGNDELFARSLLNNVDRKHSIVSARDLKRKFLDPNKPQKSIEYYYGIRSNSVHRGKAVYDDYDIIKHALGELLAIFEDIINNSWEDNL